MALLGIGEIVLAAVAFVQSILILGLMREVGLIQIRVGPAMAMATGDRGLVLGSETPTIDAIDVDGHEFAFGREYGFAHLVVSPACGVCHELVGPIGILAKAEKDVLDVIVVCEARAADCKAFLNSLATRCRIVPDPEGRIRQIFRVDGSSFAQVIDREGRAGQSGVVNNLQHLESLLGSLSNTGEVLIDERQVGLEPAVT